MVDIELTFMDTLTSARNPALQQIRKAILRGSLTDAGFCVAEGFHLLEEALRSGCEIDVVYVADRARAAWERRASLEASIRTVQLSDELFEKIAATETTQGLLSLVKPPVWTVSQLFAGQSGPQQSLLVVLDRIQDPGNAGAILRAAEAFGASGAVLLKGSVNPYNPKALRASAGSTFRFPLMAGLEESALLEALQHHRVELFALMPQGSLSLEHSDLEGSCAIVAGSEGSGVSQSLSRRSAALRIPTLGVESLNAAMAATVALYEACRQRRAGVATFARID